MKSSPDGSVVRLPDFRELAQLHGDSVAIDNPGFDQLSPEDQLKSAEKRAGEIIAKAGEEADRLMRLAKSDAEVLKEQAQKDGYKDGAEQAKEEHDRLMAEEKEQFAAQMETLEGYRDSVFADIRKYMMDMLLYLAKKVLWYEFDKSDHAINEMIDQTVESLKEQTNLTLKVSKEDYELLDLAALQAHGVVIITDDHMRHGEIKISCDAEDIDIGLPGQLKRLEADAKE